MREWTARCGFVRSSHSAVIISVKFLLAATAARVAAVADFAADECVNSVLSFVLRFVRVFLTPTRFRF